MRRALLLGAAAASALLSVAWEPGGGRTSTSPPPIATAAAPPPRQTLAPEDRAPGFETGRKLFEYGREEHPAKPFGIAEPHERHRTAPEATPPSDPVRLVGVVRRGGEVRAALSVLGEVVILAPGETSSGYTLLAIDEDLGARLRGPSGTEVTAPAP